MMHNSKEIGKSMPAVVPYELFDNDGNVFIVNVTPREVSLLDLDSKRRYQIISDLKAANQKPSSRWLPADTSLSPISDGAGVDSSYTASTEESDDTISPFKKRTRAVAQRPEGSGKSRASLTARFNSFGIIQPSESPADEALPVRVSQERQGAENRSSNTPNMNDEVVGQERQGAENRSTYTPNVTDEVVGQEVGATTSQGTTSQKGGKWSHKSDTSRLLVEIGRRIEELKSIKRGNKRRNIWRDIAAALSSIGRRYSDDDCITKKRSMDAYFKRVERFDGYSNAEKKGTKWIFFDGMKALQDGKWSEELTIQYCTEESVDIPTDGFEAVGSSEVDVDNVFGQADAIQPDDGQRAVAMASLPREPLGADDNVAAALLDEYDELKDAFEMATSNASRLDLFNQVASALERRAIFLSGEECLRKYDALKAKFRRESDLEKLSGGSPSKWPLLNRMLALEGEDNVTVNPPITLSCGAEAAVARTGAPNVNTAQRKTKGRPPSENRAKRLERLTGSNNPTLPTRHNQQLDLNRRRVESCERFVEEFSGFRADMRERTAAMKDVRDLLNQLKRGNNNQGDGNL